MAVRQWTGSARRFNGVGVPTAAVAIKRRTTVFIRTYPYQLLRPETHIACTRRDTTCVRLEIRINKTIKAARLEAVEHDASARPQNLSSASCDLDLWPLHSSCCDGYIYRNTCLSDWVNIRWIVHEISHQRDFCDLLRSPMTLNFGLLTPIVDLFMPCSVECLAVKIG